MNDIHVIGQTRAERSCLLSALSMRKARVEDLRCRSLFVISISLPEQRNKFFPEKSTKHFAISTWAIAPCLNSNRTVSCQNLWALIRLALNLEKLPHRAAPENKIAKCSTRNDVLRVKILYLTTTSHLEQLTWRLRMLVGHPRSAPTASFCFKFLAYMETSRDRPFGVCP
jgi:hypothetical protein